MTIQSVETDHPQSDCFKNCHPEARCWPKDLTEYVGLNCHVSGWYTRIPGQRAAKRNLVVGIPTARIIQHTFRRLTVDSMTRNMEDGCQKQSLEE